MRTQFARREARAGLLFLMPSLAGFALFYLLPFGVMLTQSVTQGVGSPRFVGLANYAELLQNEVFRLAAANTLRFEAVCVPLICVLSFAMALGLRRVRSFALRAAIILPLVLPVAAVSMIFHILLADGGAVQQMLVRLGLPEVLIMQSSAAFWALVGFYLWKNLGYTVILFLAGLNAIPRERYDAAAIDGAGAWQSLRHITLPGIAPTVGMVCILAVIRSFGAFREAYLLAGAYPHESIYMLQHFMQNNFAALNYQRLSTAALLVFAVIFVPVWIMLCTQRKEE